VPVTCNNVIHSLTEWLKATFRYVTITGTCITTICPQIVIPLRTAKEKEAGGEGIGAVFSLHLYLLPQGTGRGGGGERELTALKVVKEIFFPMLSISRTALHGLKVPSLHSRILLIPAARSRVALSAPSSQELVRDRTRFSATKGRKSQGTAYLVVEVYIWDSVHHKPIIYNKQTRCNSGSIVFINNYRHALQVSDALCVHHQEHYKL